MLPGRPGFASIQEDKWGFRVYVVEFGEPFGHLDCWVLFISGTFYLGTHPLFLSCFYGDCSFVSVFVFAFSVFAKCFGFV